MNRIPTTGGAGFPGSHLYEKLIADGHDILCVDNFFRQQNQYCALHRHSAC
ncbi:MAG: NAD-dependent epimerase/dehydratase family protein [Gallionella sp.]